MRLFTVVMFLHLLGALALFIGYGIEWVSSALFRNASSTEEVRAWLRVFKVSPPLSGAGLGIVILTGGYLGSLSGAMKQGWIPVSLLGIGVALLIGFIVVLPAMRGIRKSLPTHNEPVSGALRLRLSEPLLLTGIRVRVLTAVGVLYLMVVKDRLLPSLLALAAAMFLGVLLSFPAWRRQNA